MKSEQQKIEALFEIFSESHEGLIITDLSGKLIGANPAFCEMVGLKLNDLIEKFFAFDSKEAWKFWFPEGELREALFLSASTGPFLSKIVIPGLSSLSFELDFRLVKPANNQTKGFCWATAKKQHKFQGVESGSLDGSLKNSLLLSAIEQLDEIVMLSNSAGILTYVNAAFERITGYSSEEALGKNPDFLKSGLLPDEFYRDKWDTIYRGEVWKGEFSNRKKNGEIYTEEAVVSPVKDRHGILVGFIAIKQDISERLLLNREKDRLEEQFHQSQKIESVGRLAGGIAHDLNNLLTPILGYAELILQEFSDEDSWKKAANEIIRASLRARDLIRQLLIYGRKQILQFSGVNINDLLENFQDLLSRTVREDIEIKYFLADDLPMVFGDIGQLEQIFMNLIINSQDSMVDGGAITIETRPVEIDEKYVISHDSDGVIPGRYVQIVVNDTGSGIPHEIQPYIFDPFFTTKEVDKGTGLGLSTVYGIVKQHKGLIWVYSEPGIGTTFKIYLPEGKDLDCNKVVEEMEPELVGGSERILLVEDNEPVRSLSSCLLTKLGYRVFETESPTLALRLISEGKETFDLLLTDVIMPEMNGKKLHEEVIKLLPDMKVIFMSGYTGNVLNRHGIIEDGMNFVEKPFSIKTLSSSIRNVLDE